MYFGMGIFAGSLLCVAAVPLVHNRAERLTMARLQNAVPISIGEVIAEKDILRADFAVTICRQEQRIEKLTESAAMYLSMLSKNTDTINKLKATREEQKIEILDLKSQIETLKERLATPLVPKLSLFPSAAASRSKSNAA